MQDKKCSKKQEPLMNTKSYNPKSCRKLPVADTKIKTRENKWRNQEKEATEMERKPATYGKSAKPLKLRSIRSKKDLLLSPPTLRSQQKISPMEKKKVLPCIRAKEEDKSGVDITPVKVTRMRYEKGTIKNVLIDDAQYAKFSRWVEKRNTKKNLHPNSEH